MGRQGELPPQGHVDVSKLQPAESVSSYLCHPSGPFLFKPGENLTPESIEVVKACGVERLQEVPGERIEEFQLSAGVEVIATVDVKRPRMLARPLYTPDGMLMLEKGQTISAQEAEKLVRRGILQVAVYRPEHARMQAAAESPIDCELTDGF